MNQRINMIHEIGLEKLEYAYYNVFTYKMFASKHDKMQMQMERQIQIQRQKEIQMQSQKASQTQMRQENGNYDDDSNNNNNRKQLRINVIDENREVKSIWAKRQIATPTPANKYNLNSHNINDNINAPKLKMTLSNPF